MNRSVLSSLLVLLLALAFPTFADTVRYEEFSPAVTYDSNWEFSENSGLSGGSLISSDVAGAKITINFTGTGISWIGYACNCTAGVARILLDGQVHGTANSYDTTRRPQATVYRIENLPNAAHVLTIEVTGQTVFLGEGSVVAFDAFDVNEPGTTVIQEHAPAVSYEGSWTDFADPTTSGGSVVGANTAGAAAVVNFTGAAISWIGYQCPCSSGVSRVLVDGVLVNDRVFVNSTERVPQKEHYLISGLSYGPHTLRIELTGETVGDGPWVLIDAFHALSSSTGPDTEKPTVTMTSPLEGEVLHGTMTFTADASDNVGVARVRFYVFGSGFNNGLVGEDTTAPYSVTWDSTVEPNFTGGEMYAEAIDTSGNKTQSTHYRAYLQQEDYTPPTAALTQPTAGATLSGTVTLAATASDNVGVRAVFFRTTAKSGGNGTFASDETAPYEITLDTLPLLDGQSKFSVHARDLVDTPSHHRNTEVPVWVTINNSLAPGRIRVDSADTGIAYSGAWTTLQEIEDFRVYEWNTARAATEAGATASFTFNGTGVRWRSLRCNVCGIADVSIDGGAAFRINLTGSSPFAHVNQARTGVVFESPALANASHTITMTVVSSGQQVLVDAFDVLQP